MRIFDIFAAYEIGPGLKTMSQWLDDNRHLLKLREAKRGFMLLRKRWVLERSFAWQPAFEDLQG